MIRDGHTVHLNFSEARITVFQKRPNKVITRHELACHEHIYAILSLSGIPMTIQVDQFLVKFLKSCSLTAVRYGSYHYLVLYEKYTLYSNIKW